MKRKSKIPCVCLLALVFLCTQCNRPIGKDATISTAGSVNKAEMWLTKADQSVLLQKQSNLITFGTTANGFENIEVNSAVQYQTIDGFGYTLTGGSAVLINQLDETAKNQLLNELFGKSEESIAVSYIRLSIGASDLDSIVFSYNDLAAGETDIDQTKFSISPDQHNLIPLLKKIVTINPNIKLLGSPWSPPVWMKDNGKSIGGSLKPEYYNSYAKYFVKYIQSMKAEGITIDAITVQNEPLHPGNNPSMYMTPEQQRDFIKNSLGPAFKSAGIKTKIIIYDHNLDRTDYPITILNDADAKQYIDGSAFHLYAGNVSGMTTVHTAHPDKNLYFTEQWTGSKGTFSNELKWHIKNVIIGTIRNWSKNALEWNLANDPGYKPHTPGGCSQCKGALTVNGTSVTRNVSYYIIAHASKFVPAGSKRIESSVVSNLPNVAFLTPSGKKVMIVLNEGAIAIQFNLKDSNKWAPVMIEANSVATIVW